MPIPATVADKIFDILIREAGAYESERVNFTFAQRDGCTEYRFCGYLGFGGKFWNYLDKWYVTCYKEDETPERLEIINRTNEALQKLERDT